MTSAYEQEIAANIEREHKIATEDTETQNQPSALSYQLSVLRRYLRADG